MSAWIQHVKRFQEANGCSYKDALKHASATYQKGSGAMGLSKSDMGVPSSKQGSGLRNTTNPGMHITGGNLKKATKAQLIRLIGALGDKGIQKLSGMGRIGDMLKESAANNTVRLMDSGTNRATSEMETQGTGMRKVFPGFYGHDLLASTRGRGVNRLKKANRWQTFVDSTLRDTIDTGAKAGRAYYDTTSPLAQLGFGLKKHKKLSGRALLAAGYA